MGRKPGGKVGGASERDQRLARIAADAKLLVPGGPARPVGDGDAGGTAGGGSGAGGNGGKPADAGKSPAPSALVAADALTGQVVDSLRGYHELGFALTGHGHWREIKEDRRERAAGTLARIIERLPPAAQTSLLLALAWSSAGLVGFEMFAAPVVASVKLSRAEKKKKSDDAKKKTEGGPVASE